MYNNWYFIILGYTTQTSLGRDLLGLSSKISAIPLTVEEVNCMWQMLVIRCQDKLLFFVWYDFMVKSRSVVLRLFFSTLALTQYQQKCLYNQTWKILIILNVVVVFNVVCTIIIFSLHNLVLLDNMVAFPCCLWPNRAVTHQLRTTDLNVYDAFS